MFSLNSIDEETAMKTIRNLSLKIVLVVMVLLLYFNKK